MKNLFQKYSDAVLSGLDSIIERFDTIATAGKMLAESKLEGGRWVLYDKGWAMSLDTWTRGSNPCDNHIYGIKRYENMFYFLDSDCLILGSYYADDPEDAEIVKKLREKNNTRLITISPHKKPVDPRTQKLLYETADIAIDNGSVNGGGAFTAKEVKGAILPYARDINLTILQAIVAEYNQNMVNAWCPPTQFYMVHFPYFREIQDIMNKRIEKYGY